MLSRLAKSAYVQAILLALAALLVLGAISSIFGLSGEICNQNGECPGYNFVLAGLWKIIEIANWASPAITACATIAIACFTLTLYRATNSQASTAQKSIDLARDEFNATHRPEIIVHAAMNATAVKIGGGTAFGINVIYFNKGTSPAKNTKLFASIIPVSFGTDLEDGLNISLVGEHRGSVVAGKPYSFTTWSNVSIEETESGPVRPDGSWEHPKRSVYCVGNISYEDDSGIQRQTGFCWKWERKKWLRVTENSYDYAY